MSTKPKYTTSRFNDALEHGRKYAVFSPKSELICEGCSQHMARKIARALNAMEKPKAKPFEFDWTGVDPKYKWAAMDSDGDWPLYFLKPRKPAKDSAVWPYGNGKWTFCRPRPNPYPGDWRDSLQKRP